MGNVCQAGDVDPEQTKRSKEIDDMLKESNKNALKKVKLLLLGAAESGKSTIFKQMKLLQVDGGFRPEELEAYRTIVQGNCLTQIKTLIRWAEKLGYEYEVPANKEKAASVLRLAPGAEGWSNQAALDVKALWADAAIKKAYERRDSDFHLNDSASYFFDNIDRFIEPNYVPSTQDVLRARVRTTGIEEAQFTFEDLSFTMLDVGGQRSERRKWIHCFDAVTACIFCVSLSEYDQMLREDETINRMKESLALFEEVSNVLWFKTTPFVLFLNKTDLFREKIKRKPLTICFNDYTGPAADYDAGLEFIQKKFVGSNTSPHDIYVHQTCATNTDNVRVVFKAVRDTLKKKILGELF